MMIYTNEAAWYDAIANGRDAGLIDLDVAKFLHPKSGLPNILIIGDSISMYYTPYVRKLLSDKANVYRIPDNGGNTAYGLSKIHLWLGDLKWETIHFNWGLHDLATSNGIPVHTPEVYEKQLNQLVDILLKTEARLIWATTTPVPEGAGSRVQDSEIAYNEKAAQIMNHHGIAINDLHSFIKGDLELAQHPRNVHFKEAGSEMLGNKVAEALGY